MKFQYTPIHVTKYDTYEVIGGYVAINHKEEDELFRVVAKCLAYDPNPEFVSVFIIRENDRVTFQGFTRDLFQERFDEVDPGETFKYRKTWKRLDLEEIRHTVEGKKFREAYRDGMPTTFKKTHTVGE